MKIMTFNLRFENDRDGPNSWVFRRDLVIQLINRYAPSIPGTQEGTCSQIWYLRDHLPEYHLHAPNRVYDDTCQYPTLFVKMSSNIHVKNAFIIHDHWEGRFPSDHFPYVVDVDLP